MAKSDVIAEILKQKYAKNDFEAFAIYNLLSLGNVVNVEQAVERTALYRRWRNSNVFGRETLPCAEMALAGIDCPGLEL